MRITVIGDAFIDMLVPVIDIKPGDTYHRNIAIACGGTATVAVQAARLNAQAGFVGKVGDDAFGTYFRENLKRHNVEDLTFVDHQHTTGLCVSLSNEDGERTMIASRGANDYLTGDEVKRHLDKILDSEIVYFSGYSLISGITASTIPRIMEACRKHGCQVWFNPGAPNIIDNFFKGIIEKTVDTLLLNMEEAQALSGETENDNILNTLGKLASSVTITMGKEGCIVQRKGHRIKVPVSDVLEGLDTTGAGDAFSAGFIRGKLSRKSDRECAEMGHSTAVLFLKERA